MIQSMPLGHLTVICVTVIILALIWAAVLLKEK